MRRREPTDWRALFRARTSETDLGSGLPRDPSDALPWLDAGAPPTLSFLGDLLRFTGLERLSSLGLGALVSSKPTVLAISSPNRATTSVSLSTFAAPGGALDSGESRPALAISSFSSTPRSTKRS